MSRVWRFLRSRTLAIWIILAFVVYSGVATTLSDGDWTVPYRSPIFLAIAVLLTASTAACAWERTRAALKNAPVRLPSPPTIERLRTRPGIVVSASAGADQLGQAERALRRLRMRVVRTGDVLEARTGLAGAFGSPIFHWALALLFVFVALGQLTRAEGSMGVVAGHSKPDAPESYGSIETGPWAGALTGRTIAVPAVETSFTANGVDQGMTPLIEIRDAQGDVLTSGYAYPNHPVRYRSMLIHADTDGLGAVVSVAGAGETMTQQVLLDFKDDSAEVEPGILGIGDSSGATLFTVMLEPTSDSTVANPLVRVRASRGESMPDTAPEIDMVVPCGGSVELPDGLTLTVIDLTKYARLTVVDDWSVYWIYALFVLAVIGLVMALFFPLRAVRVLAIDDSDGARLHVAVRHGRGDPHFPGRVETVLREAMEAEEVL